MLLTFCWSDFYNKHHRGIIRVRTWKMTYADFIIHWNTSTASLADWELYAHVKSKFPNYI